MITLTLGKKIILIDDIKTPLFSNEKIKKSKEEKSQEETLAAMKSGTQRE